MRDEMLLMGNNKTTIFLAVLFMLFIFIAVTETSISANETVGKQEVKHQNNPHANVQTSIKIIPSAKKTFGYDILLYGRPLIH
jgi:hypothetical protein